MKLLIRSTIVLLIACMTFTACDQLLTDARKAEIETELLALTQDIFDQFNNRDTATVYTNYSDDFSLLSRGAFSITKPGEFEKFTSKAKLGMASRVPYEYKISDVHVEVYSENVANVYYKYTSTDRYDDVTINYNSVSTWIMVKEGGQWKIKHAHISSGKDRFRAVESELVWVLINHVKADRTEDFEQLLDEIFMKAKELGGLTADIFSTMRILYPDAPNKDGSFTYIFIADPYIQDANYYLKPFLEQMYEEDVVEEKLKIFNESLVEPQSGYMLVQSEY